MDTKPSRGTIKLLDSVPDWESGQTRRRKDSGQVATVAKAEQRMRIGLLAIPVLLCQSGFGADETSTFRAYVDTDICARLMLGPITPERKECSEKMGKDKNEPVLVRLSNNMVFAVNKQKMIEKMVGQLAEVSGDIKVKAGTMKLQDVKPVEPGAIPAGPERRLLERGAKTEPNPQTWEKVRHELAMMPYVTEFDFISFTMTGPEVILTGWTVRQTNRDYRLQRGEERPRCGERRQQHRYSAAGQLRHADPRRRPRRAAAQPVPVLLGKRIRHQDRGQERADHPVGDGGKQGRFRPRHYPVQLGSGRVQGFQSAARGQLTGEEGAVLNHGAGTGRRGA